MDVTQHCSTADVNARLNVTVLKYLCSAVDVLGSVGLRDGDIVEDGATVAEGPSGTMDAFLLSRQLSAATNGTDWNILNAYFPQEFALYVVFNASQYSGSIVAINRGMSDEFNVALRTSPLLNTQTLIVTFPGVDPAEITVPTQDNPMFQFIGVRLQGTVLTVFVNCTLVSTLRLSALPRQLPISENSMVEIFEQPTTVSFPH